RSSDHRAGGLDRAAGADVDRHVEVYSWGGLTSQSKVRVLWLALLPFLFGNLAGWMCSVRTRESAWRFRLHRLAAGLGGLALTVNAALIAVLFVLALTWLASKTWRYEAVRPPYKVEPEPKKRKPARKITAAALKKGLADDEFWDGEGSVRLVTWLHLAVILGFLAIVLGVTTKALTVTGSPHVVALGWIAIGLGGVTVALGVGYICLDALGTPPKDAPDGSRTAVSALADKLRGWMVYLLVPGAAALIAAGVFAWLQPGGPTPRAAELPGMAGVIGWTTLAIAVVVAVALISMLLGLTGGQGTLIGGSWVTLMLGFSVLNTVLLGAEIWVAHLVGPVTSDAADALSRPQG